MRVLITTGPVYGRLDDNKLVGNRTRGIWAARFASHLNIRGHEVTLLAADTWDFPHVDKSCTIVRHQGYDDYAEKCYAFARTHDAAVMASAVVNWIPKSPFPGKMPTEGYAEGDEIQVPFYLAPRVINRMRRINPNLTLVGCKMLVGSTEEHLIDAAYHVILQSGANVVLANDLDGLRRKLLVYPDRAVVPYDNEFTDLFYDLTAVIEDKHWRTEESPDILGGPAEVVLPAVRAAQDLMSRVIDTYRDRFIQRVAGSDLVFGSVAVPLALSCGGYLVSPREKGHMFSGTDGILVGSAENGVVRTVAGKATMNAPLLLRMLQGVPEAAAVLHLHEQLPGATTTAYAPPGTDRDNYRHIPGPVFNIKRHGFIACLDQNLEFLR